MEIVYDREGIIEKFGVPPESIPDYLGVVGDTAWAPMCVCGV